MLLLFTTQDINASQRNFSWWFTTIETALDALSSIASRENKLIKAELIDEDHRISLPVDAFDGSFLSPVINELELEWQFLLNEPA
ncbi:hypothetical protein [Spirosoma sp.]|uniref:hypothetical protein n=1 Tax=Spirosoma sp. TaxID=1899569 RepID=UPI002633BF8E|nr:hypothetical protein [Spirosoma sp.]MCX6216448.1 hypothetical protein [Spirosoma sp.]